MAAQRLRSAVCRPHDPRECHRRDGDRHHAERVRRHDDDRVARMVAADRHVRPHGQRDVPAAGDRSRRRLNDAFNLVGVLRAGYDESRAPKRQLDALAVRLATEYPESDKDRAFVLAGVPRMSVSSRPQTDSGPRRDFPAAQRDGRARARRGVSEPRESAARARRRAAP